MQRATIILLLTCTLLAGCLGGQISQEEALQTVESTDSYQQIPIITQTDVWTIEQDDIPETAPNLTEIQDASEKDKIVYGIMEFSDIELRPGYIVRATGAETGYYYHLGTDGTIHGTVSMTELQDNIATAMQEQVEAMREEIEHQQTCTGTSLQIRDHGYDPQTQEAHVAVGNTGTVTIQTLTITFEGTDGALETVERSSVEPGSIETATVTTQTRPEAVHVTPTGCPEAGVNSTLE